MDLGRRSGGPQIQACLQSRSGAVEETTPDEALALFDINVFGVVRMVRAVLPAMRHRIGEYRAAAERASATFDANLKRVPGPSIVASEIVCAQSNSRIACDGRQVARRAS
jgi:NAD(P)-dependent dehydrogenase (short-subunit alcohol dehydrogenase family)